VVKAGGWGAWVQLVGAGTFACPPRPDPKSKDGWTRFVRVDNGYAAVAEAVT
jgi:hypothetical protein